MYRRDLLNSVPFRYSAEYKVNVAGAMLRSA